MSKRCHRSSDLSTRRNQCWRKGARSVGRCGDGEVEVGVRIAGLSEVGVWRMSLPSSRGEADLVFTEP